MSAPDRDVEWLLRYVEEDADICSEVNGERDAATLEARRIETTVKRLVRENAHVATLTAQARAEALEDYAKAVEDRTVKFYPIVMPVKNGVGPADLGEEVTLTWEVWEAGTLNAISSHEYLSDAIAAAIRARKDTQ